jgi:hypothetical protein
MDTKLLKSSSYHPQIDGQSERVNKCLEMYLRCVVYDSPNKWNSWFSLAKLWYNTSFHSSLGCSPFKGLYGYEADTGVGVVVPETTTSDTAQLLLDRESHMTLLKDRLAQAQHKMKTHVDLTRTER